uniref:Uncharacterized protein n=1 Tax=Arundo donax TaxID=35708 RepID=A0A0A9CL09_ARUDO
MTDRKGACTPNTSELRRQICEEIYMSPCIYRGLPGPPPKPK